MNEQDSENLRHILSELSWANIFKAYELRLRSKSARCIWNEDICDEIEKVCVEYINGVYFSEPEGE